MSTMKFLLIFAALALAEACDIPKFIKCDQNILNCCDNNFKTALNVTCFGKQIYQQPDCIEKVLIDTYFSGEESAFQICG